MKIKTALLISTVALLLANCTELVYDTQTGNSNNNKPVSGSFAERLKAYKRKDPVKEATQAAQQGQRYLMATASRGGMMAPGIDNNTFKRVQNRCPGKVAYGMGDAIKGRDHLDYQKFMFTYAMQFNQKMISFCQ